MHAPQVGVPVVAAAPYEGGARAALLAYKERGRRDLVLPLAQALRAVLRTLPAGAIVPVPSSAAAARARGGDHLLRLARAAGRPERREIDTPLTLRRAVRDSVGLGVDDRHANLRYAMTARPPRTRRAAVLVDDVVTTGATLTEARRALDAAGWSLVAAAVVAATPRRDSITARPS